MPTLPQINMANRITKLDTSTPDKRLSTPPKLSQNRRKLIRNPEPPWVKQTVPPRLLMLSDPIRIADVINNPKFHAGDEVVLAEGPHKYVHGTFLRVKDDVEWGLQSKKQTELSAATLLSGCAAIAGRVCTSPQMECRKSDPMGKFGIPPGLRWLWHHRKILMRTNQLVDGTARAKTTMIEADQFSPTGDATAVLAYRYWTERDRSIGSPEEDWLRAENEIKHSRTPGSVV